MTDKEPLRVVDITIPIEEFGAICAELKRLREQVSQLQSSSTQNLQQCRDRIEFLSEQNKQMRAVLLEEHLAMKVEGTSPARDQRINIAKIERESLARWIASSEGKMNVQR